MRRFCSSCPTLIFLRGAWDHIREPSRSRCTKKVFPCEVGRICSNPLGSPSNGDGKICMFFPRRGFSEVLGSVGRFVPCKHSCCYFGLSRGSTKCIIIAH